MGRNKKDVSDKPTKTVFWICEYGCGEVNVRKISYDSIINDDICDACDKYYHEPSTRTKRR